MFFVFFLTCQQLIYSRFYSGKSAIDSCTMFSDRNLINRGNVAGDVTSSYRPDRDFLQIVFQSRVIAAAKKVLQDLKTRLESQQSSTYHLE